MRLWLGGRWNQNCAIATQRKIDEGVWLAWSLKLLIYSLFYRGKYFTVLLLLFLHTKTKGRGRRENNNKLLPKFPPKLCQLLYIFIVNWMPPPPPVLTKFVYFAIAQFGRKSRKQSPLFCGTQFLQQTRCLRNYLSICLVITPEFYDRV